MPCHAMPCAFVASRWQGRGCHVRGGPLHLGVECPELLLDVLFEGNKDAAEGGGRVWVRGQDREVA